MADFKIKYGSVTTMTVTLASLANASKRESTAIDNYTSNLYLDVLVAGKVTTGTSPSATGRIDVYAYAKLDDGSGSTDYTAGATGSDAGITLDTPETNNLIYLGSINNDSTNDQTYEFGPYSIAAAFGGSVPAKWGLIFDNQSGAALNSTSGNHAIKYQGIQNQSV